MYLSVLLEGVPLCEEVLEEVLRGDFALLDVCAARGVIDSDEVLEVDDATAVLVELLECLLYDGATCLVHVTTNEANELAVADLVVEVLVEVLEEVGFLRLRQCKSGLLKSPFELLTVQ